MLPTDVDLEQAVKRSEVVVLGVPSKDFELNADFMKPGAVVINVSHYKNVDEEKLKARNDVKYVPLIGKVTVAMLERNLLRLVDNFHLPNERCRLLEAGGRIDPFFKPT